MEILLGKYAGFCYGVKLALDTAYKNAGKIKICTLGQLIHNKTVTDELAAKGVRIIEKVSEALPDETILIRSHGVPKKIYDEINERGLNYIDCTCPHVKKIHKIVNNMEIRGKNIIIVGDKSHPEVEGICGHVSGEVVYLANASEIDNIIFDLNYEYGVVVQTTFVLETFNEIITKLKQISLNLEIENTICAATTNRQNEASLLSKNCDLMLIIGDKNSSNANKLLEICKQNCERSFLLESARDLELNNLETSVRIGLTAGASTPLVKIEEAYSVMSDFEGNNENESFEELLENSNFTLRSGEVVTGVVSGVSESGIMVNLGFKADGFIPRVEFSSDTNIDLKSNIKIGDEVEVYVIKINDGEGNVLLSKRKVDLKKDAERIQNAFENKTPVRGKIVEAIKGGMIADFGNFRAFVPASQIGDRFYEDLSIFIGKEFDFLILEYDRRRRKYVAGRREMAAKEREAMKTEIFGKLKVGDTVTGTVTRLANFGAFVDLGGADGLIHVSELSWGHVKKVSDVLNVGDIVKVTILELDPEKGKISLTLKDVNSDPWNNIEYKYPIGETVTAEVVRFAQFGAFVKLEEGVDGLIHISQIANKHVVKPSDELKIGETVTLKVLDVDAQNKKISLSKKAVDSILDEKSELIEDALQDEVFASNLESEAADDLKNGIENSDSELIVQSIAEEVVSEALSEESEDLITKAFQNETDDTMLDALAENLVAKVLKEKEKNSSNE